MSFPLHSRVLFQGDSITDMNRGRTDDPNHILGHSYAFLIAAKSAAAHPEREIEFLNRGVSGNKVADLMARWQQDTIDLKPTILSILVGINDLETGVPAEKFEADYDALLTRSEAALPGVKLVVCEPFGLATGWRKSRWPEMGETLTGYRSATRRLAKKHHAVFIPLQQVFDTACRRAPAEFWIWDGIHPTYAGQQLIADAWVRSASRTLTTSSVSDPTRRPRQ